MTKAYNRLSGAVAEMVTMEKLRQENERLRASLSAIATEAERPSSKWPHLKRVIALQAGDALEAELHQAVADGVQTLREALRAIIARADTDKPGTSKVQDMKRIALDALGG